MKKIIFAASCLLMGLASCGPAQETTNSETETVDPALCEFVSIDSVSAQTKLRGEWKLAGVQPNHMGGQPAEFLTGEQIKISKRLVFLPNNEFERTINGASDGVRQKYVVQGEGLTPLAYRFWFCGDNTLVLSNIAADGPTEVYIRQ